MEEKAILEACPLCGSPLEKGYIASKMVAWGQNKKIISEGAYAPRFLFRGFWAVGAETIIGKWPYDVKAVEAYRCRKCNLIIFRYEK